MVCNEPGECKPGLALATSVTVGQSGCHRFCKKHLMCNWFTYNPDTVTCSAFADCTLISAADCPDCFSAHKDCPVQQNQCSMRGLCQGGLIKIVISSLIFFFSTALTSTGWVRSTIKLFRALFTIQAVHCCR